jgi:AcrR family transcriptional regulator
MAYRKTEKVLAQLEAKRSLILACAIDVVGKPGFDGALVEATAARAGVSVGLLYNYFPDRTELFAAVVASVLARDLAEMRERAKEERDALQALVGAMVVLLNRFSGTRVSQEVGAEPIYEKGVRDELARLIGAAIDIAPADVRLAARGVLGALCGMAKASGPESKRASAAIVFALRGIGVTEARVQRVIAKGWGLAAVG